MDGDFPRDLKTANATSNITISRSVGELRQVSGKANPYRQPQRMRVHEGKLREI